MTPMNALRTMAGPGQKATPVTQQQQYTQQQQQQMAMNQQRQQGPYMQQMQRAPPMYVQQQGNAGVPRMGGEYVLNMGPRIGPPQMMPQQLVPPRQTGYQMPQTMGPSPLSMTVPSPQSYPQQMHRPAPSPVTLNTPASVQPVHSPSTMDTTGDDSIIGEKLRQMSKYIEPLREVIQREERSGAGRKEQVNKLMALLGILCNQRKTTIELLIQCEKTLEKILPQQKQVEQTQSQPIIYELKSHSERKDSQQLLSKTFASLKDTLHGGKSSRIRGPSPEPLPAPDPMDSWLTVQREVSSLQSIFTVNRTESPTDKSTSILLMCSPRPNKHSPTLPAVFIRVPKAYPSENPTFLVADSLEKLRGTTALAQIRQMLDTKLLYLPDKYSVSHLVHTYELCVKSVMNDKT